MFNSVFEMVGYYYNKIDENGKRLWNIDRVYNVVGKPNSITQEEYQKITGFIYPAKS